LHENGVSRSSVTLRAPQAREAVRHDPAGQEVAELLLHEGSGTPFVGGRVVSSKASKCS
jgi:hypothetical protein